MVTRHKWRVLFSVIGISALAATALAQVNATVVTKSGQRYTGSTGYWRDRPEVFIRTSFQAEPSVPVDQVAYIDFGGSADPVSLNGSDQALVLRNGTAIRGQVLEMHPDQQTGYVFKFRTSGGEVRQFDPSEIARVWFSEPAGSVATRGTAVPNAVTRRGAFGRQRTTVTVPATQTWTPTGLNVQAGERYAVDVTGQIAYSPDPQHRANRQGSLVQYRSNDSPLPDEFAGALIGRIDNGQPFVIGGQSQVSMPANGTLYLGVNDTLVNDNSGAFEVTLVRR